MKKIFSLLCAAVMVLSANAAGLQHLNVAKQQTKDANRISMRQELKQAKPSQQAGALKLMAAAPKAELTVNNITIGEVTTKFYSTDNDVYIVMYSDDEAYGFCFDVVVPAGQQDLTDGTTYTLTDMLANYTYGQNLNTQENITFTAVSLVRTAPDGLTRYEVTATDDNGDTWNLVYQKAPCVATDTIAVGALNTDCDLIDMTSSGVFQFMGGNNDYYAYVAIYSSAIIGSYISNDLYLDYTSLYDFQGGDTTQIKVCGGDVVVTAGANAGDYNLTATLIGMDGHAYSFTMAYVKPTAETTKTITATDLVVDATYFDLYMAFFGYGLFNAYAANDTVALEFESTSTIAGTYTEGVSGTIEGSEVYSCNLVVAEDGAYYTLTGTVLCKNNCEYTLNLSYVLPTKTRDLTVNITGELDDLVSSYGAWQAVGESNEFVAVVTVKATDIAGTYTGADNYAAGYTYVGEIVGGDTLFHLALDMNLTVTVNGTQAVITGTILGQNYDDATDVPEINFTMTCDIIEPSSCMDYDATEDDGPYSESFAADDAEVEDQYFEQYGVVYVTAENADGATVTIEFNDENYDGTITPGVYTIDDSGDNKTVTASPGVQSGSVYPSFAGYLTEDGYIQTPLYFFESGTVTVGSEYIIVNAVNSCEQTITIQIGSGSAVEEVNGQTVKASKAIRNGQLVIRANDKEYNAQGAQL